MDGLLMDEWLIGRKMDGMNGQIDRQTERERERERERE